MKAENIAITGHGVFDGSGDSWRPVKRNKMTDGQWKALLRSGGVVDDAGKVWYPDAGALKASVLTGSKEKEQFLPMNGRNETLVASCAAELRKE